MKGKITAIGATADGRKVAKVELEGVEGSLDVAYWPELLDQWGADTLRSWLLHQAAQAVIEPPADEDPHSALIGEGEAKPVEIKPDEQAPAEPGTMAAK